MLHITHLQLSPTPAEVLIFKGDNIIARYNWNQPRLLELLAHHRSKSHTLRVRWHGLDELTPIIMSGNYVYPGFPKEMF